MTIAINTQLPAPASGASILVPLDGSSFAEAALPQALALAPLLGGDLVLLRVVQYQPVIAPLGWPVTATELVDDLCTMLRTEAQEYLAQISARIEAGGAHVQTRLVESERVAETVCKVAGEVQAGVIALSTHGRSGVGRWLLGSVADEVVHSAPVPVLLVRPGPLAAPLTAVAPYQTLLVPLDGSPLAEQALLWAVPLAARGHARIKLLAVVPPPTTPAPAVSDSVPLVAGYLEGMAEQLTALGIPTTIHVGAGEVATEILHQAEVSTADLIVMGTHGRTGLPRLRLGSVATKVVQASPLPVLLVGATAATTI